MNKALNGFGLVLLGTLLMAGCGGMEPEPMDIPQDASASTEGPQQSLADPDPVTTETACCYVLCSDKVWRGPYRHVSYGHCQSYGKYKCANGGVGYEGVKWDDC
jgi:hypothetical protein